MAGNDISKLLEDPKFSTVSGTTRCVSAWPTVDSQVSCAISGCDGWRKWLDQTTVRIGASSLFNRSAPFAAGAFNDFHEVKTHRNRGRFGYTDHEAILTRAAVWAVSEGRDSG